MADRYSVSTGAGVAIEEDGVSVVPHCHTINFQKLDVVEVTDAEVTVAPKTVDVVLTGETFNSIPAVLGDGIPIADNTVCELMIQLVGRADEYSVVYIYATTIIARIHRTSDIYILEYDHIKPPYDNSGGDYTISLQADNINHVLDILITDGVVSTESTSWKALITGNMHSYS
jgi:hypothetical protein